TGSAPAPAARLVSPSPRQISRLRLSSENQHRTLWWRPDSQFYLFLGTGCMIKLQSSMSKHIPPSKFRGKSAVRAEVAAARKRHVGCAARAVVPGSHSRVKKLRFYWHRTPYTHHHHPGSPPWFLEVPRGQQKAPLAVMCAPGPAEGLPDGSA
ncbi:unnamed protein product, partial [Menidia menidia]